mgnify:CR=1 FL=1
MSSQPSTIIYTLTDEAPLLADWIAAAVPDALLEFRMRRLKSMGCNAVRLHHAVARELLTMGCYEVSLGDTIGTGTAGKTRTLFEVVGRDIPRDKLAGHFHDTYGQALANIYASLLEGIAVFDSSVAGLGGCPYAKGATGNVATEDVVYLLHGLGIQTGIELDKLIDAGAYISQVLGRKSASRVANAIMAKR